MATGGLDNEKKVALYEYDFAKDGGAVGDITLRGPGLPAGALVTDANVYVNTAVTSGGSATVALYFEAAADVLGATAKGSLTLAALLAGKQQGAAANMILITAVKQLKATVAAAALTAGKMTVAVEYIQQVTL